MDMFSLIIGIALISMIYLVYQIIRNEKVYRIRMVWLGDSNFSKLERYSYEYMYVPSKHNWWGLKYPTKSNFK